MSSTIAIVIGVSKYLEGRFPTLPAAQIDAVHFARALTHWGVSEVALFLNEQASINSLHQWFASLAEKGPDIKLVFYFCGHGQREADAIPNSYLHFFDDRLNLDSLITYICQLGVQESYVFIDSCSLRINTLLNPKLHEEIKGNKHSSKSLYCLLSSGIQESFENNRYGYFTDALLKSLARFRKTEPDPTQLFREICKILEMDGLPLPEMYNIGNQKISFLPPLSSLSEKEGLMPRSEMIAKIGDALIINRGKIGVVIGERGAGKTSLCRFLISEPCKTIYIKIPPFSSPSIHLIDYLTFLLKPSQSLDEDFSDSLFLMDMAENLHVEQLCQFVQEVADYRIQFLFISSQNFTERLMPSLQRYLFQVEIDSFSLEEGKQLMLSFHLSKNEEYLIYLASKGNPLKMKQIAHHFRNGIQGNGTEKEEIFKVISALYACGCYLDKELFIDVFNLSYSSVALLEELGLVCWEVDAWVPHPIFYELAEAESDSLIIQKESVLEYWYRQIKRTPNQVRSAENLICLMICFGYEKKGDPYLKIAFRSLYRDGKDHLDLFIDGAQIFRFHSEMTEASTLLAEIFSDLERFDWAEKLAQAKPLKRKKQPYIWIIALFVASCAPFLYPFIHTVSPHIMNLKQIHPDFVGRSQYLQQLQNMCLKWNHVPSISVLWGETGIGKSEIAITFANLYAKHFRLICWIDCTTEESYAASYYALAKLLRISIDQEKDLIKKVHDFLETEKSSQPWLLILDNVEQTRELPLKGKGSVIVTTRDRTPWHSDYCINIAPFQEKEAIALLKKITNNSESHQISSLIKELDFFPLTLNLAAHYIAETPEMNEELYIKLLSQNNIDLISSMPLDARYSNSLLSSWNIKADELAENEPEILQWLHFCSCLCSSGIPAFWIEKWFTDIRKIEDPFQVKIRSAEILRSLANQCLIRYEKHTHTLSLHHLKQDVMKNDRHFQKETIDQVAQFLISCSENIEKIYEKEKNLSQWSNLREWEPHAAWFLHNYSSLCSKETISSLQNLLGNWKYIKGDYKDAQNYHQQVLKNRIELYGEEHPKTIISMNNLATILWENGQFAESKDLFCRSLNASKKLYKEDHLDVIVTLNNLGWVSWEMGQFEEAKALLNQSFHISKKLRACDPDFLQTVNDFIQFLDKDPTKDNLSDIEKATERALFLRHAGLWIAEVEGNPKKSLGYFNESLELLKKTVPKEDPRIAIAYGSVGISLNRAGESKKGKHYLSKALKIQKKVLGDEHPETAKSYANLSISLVNLGKFHKALECHLKALDIRRKSLGDEHPITAKSYSGIGMTLLGLEKYNEAVFYNQKALEIRRKVLGENHSETAQSYSRLGMNFGKLGQYEKALEYNLKALDILENIFGDNHYLTANVHTTLGACYRNLGRLEHAALHEQKAEEIRRLF